MATPGLGIGYENGNEWTNSKESTNDELTQIDDMDMREQNIESQRLLSNFGIKNGGTISRIRESKTKHEFYKDQRCFRHFEFEMIDTCQAFAQVGLERRSGQAWVHRLSNH